MPSINLAPGTQYIMIARKRRIRLYGIAIAIICIFVAGTVGLYTYVKVLENESNEIKSQIAIADQSIQALREQAQRVTLFEKRLADVNTLVDNHIGWEKVFAELERLVPIETVFTSLDVESDGSTLFIEGETQSIDHVALALSSLANDVNHSSLFSSGTVKSVERIDQVQVDGSSTPRYSFSMSLDFDNVALKKTAL